MDFKIGDEVITLSPLWHHGEDVGDRLGIVISTEGYIVVELYNYNDNPIKCFRREIELAKSDDDRLLDEINLLFDKIIK